MNLDELKRVDVDLKEHGYPVFIGSDFLSQIGDLIGPYVQSKKLFIITDELVSMLYLPMVEESLDKAEFDFHVLTVPQGEMSKSLSQAGKLLERILKIGCDRQTAIVSLGGGVVGDLAGFCASVLLRGIDFIQIPTTLLSQTDSSVGGKTAVNAEAGKNLIGSFHQPKAVFIDVHTLKTLDPQQVLAGFAEVVKYGLALNVDFWNWLVDGGEQVLALDETACMYAVEQSCRIKASIVVADEFERNGLRSLLNFGHTFGHAIEAATGLRGTILHGEAIAIGSVLAAWLSAEMKLCSGETAQKVAEQYEKWGLPTQFGSLKISEMLSSMKKDKKTKGMQLNFVLMEDIGNSLLVHNINPADVEKILYEKGRKKSVVSYY